MHFNSILETATQYEVSNIAIEHARLRDFTIVVTDSEVLTDATAEDLLFKSSRPILIPPRNHKTGLELSLHSIAVAWDSSRAATRAVYDALPLLQRAKHVRIFTALNEKELLIRPRSAELKAHLARHGIVAKMENITASEKPIGEVIRPYVKKIVPTFL